VDIIVALTIICFYRSGFITEIFAGPEKIANNTFSQELSPVNKK
jgi:hypothetical protein